MTKNELRAKLEFAANLATLSQALLADICNELAPTNEDDIYDIIGSLQTCDHSGINEIMQELQDNGYLDNMPTGEAEIVPGISMNTKKISDIEISLPLEDGSKMAAFISTADDDIIQTGTIYYDKENFPLDLSVSEVKRGDLAESHGLDRNNKNIDLYLWTDPNNEDYTVHEQIAHDDIVAAMNEYTASEEEPEIDGL